MLKKPFALTSKRFTAKVAASFSLHSFTKTYKMSEAADFF